LRLKEQLAEVKRAVRLCGGKTATLATKMGVSQRTVQRWLKGSTIPEMSLKELRRVVAALQQPE